MIVIRNTFQAKYGRGDELVELLKGGEAHLARFGTTEFRLLTDLTGDFFTVVMEFQMADLAAFDRSREAFADPEFQQMMGAMVDLVESGHRDIFNVVE